MTFSESEVAGGMGSKPRSTIALAIIRLLCFIVTVVSFCGHVVFELIISATIYLYMYLVCLP